MLRSIFALFLAVAAAPSAAAAATCAGPNPAIASVAVKSSTTNGQLNTYHIVGTVTNLGGQAQASNTLQFVNIFVDRQKRDDRGIPPLKPGQSYAFGYDWTRASDAGAGTTTVRFRMDVRQGANCNPANGSQSITF
jgi:hypothetical protein